MCGIFFIYTTKEYLLKKTEEQQELIFKFLAKRGPDYMGKIKGDNHLFVHFLLAIQSYVPQPVKGKGTLCWNGEIYNTPKQYKGDTDFLLNYLDKGKINQIQELDGEYIIFYKSGNTFHILTDPFATKPGCFYLDNETMIASNYESCIKEVVPDAKVTFVEANTHYIFDLETLKLIDKKEIYHWDFVPRYDNFDRWVSAFRLSIERRTRTDKKIFVPLSSGYDSGLIVSELLNQGVPFGTYHFLANERKDIMDERLKILEKNEITHTHVDVNENFLFEYLDYVNNIDPYDMSITDFPGHEETGMSIHTNKTAVALYILQKRAQHDAGIICLSGQGADEIFADYPFHKRWSTLRGDFTGVRKKWPNFDKAQNYGIINVTERVGGALGLETRYPFLSREVIQEFLWLSDTLKNKEYKQVVAHLLRLNNFPFYQEKTKMACFPGGSNELFFDTVTPILEHYHHSRVMFAVEESTIAWKAYFVAQVLHPHYIKTYSVDILEQALNDAKTMKMNILIVFPKNSSPENLKRDRLKQFIEQVRDKNNLWLDETPIMGYYIP